MEKLRTLIIFILFASASILAFSADSNSNEIQPACLKPAPLEGQYYPEAPGYFVSLKDTFNTASETERLAKTYGFKYNPPFVTVLAGNVSPEVIAKLRCEPAVKRIDRDIPTHI